MKRKKEKLWEGTEPMGVMYSWVQLVCQKCVCLCVCAYIQVNHWCLVFSLIITPCFLRKDLLLIPWFSEKVGRMGFYSSGSFSPHVCGAHQARLLRVLRMKLRSTGFIAMLYWQSILQSPFWNISYKLDHRGMLFISTSVVSGML